MQPDVLLDSDNTPSPTSSHQSQEWREFPTIINFWVRSPSPFTLSLKHVERYLFPCLTYAFFYHSVRLPWTFKYLTSSESLTFTQCLGVWRFSEAPSGILLRKRGRRRKRICIVSNTLPPHFNLYYLLHMFRLHFSEGFFTTTKVFAYNKMFEIVDLCH